MTCGFTWLGLRIPLWFWWAATEFKLSPSRGYHRLNYTTDAYGLDKRFRVQNPNYVFKFFFNHNLIHQVLYTIHTDVLGHIEACLVMTPRHYQRMYVPATPVLQIQLVNTYSCPCCFSRNDLENRLRSIRY